MYDLTLKMTIFAIVLGKSKMCLQENLADCADCGGLLHCTTGHIYIFKISEILNFKFHDYVAYNA